MRRSLVLKELEVCQTLHSSIFRHDFLHKFLSLQVILSQTALENKCIEHRNIYSGK